MSGSHIEVEDVNWFTLWGSRKLPGLLEVLGTLLEIEVIRVGVGVAWSLDWSMWADCLGTPFVVVDFFLFMNVLAIIAIPKWVVAVLLPPLTIEVRELGINSWFWLWANSWDWSKRYATLLHGATEEIFSGLGVVSKCALGGAVLVV